MDVTFVEIQRTFNGWRKIKKKNGKKQYFSSKKSFFFVKKFCIIMIRILVY